ncbi:hypothetical protein VTP01DRAFT_3089 [Rhizomucor pusillus]|uniref:uncharacterized protein n=1 Tax=Rhizomucor pusillus TaxID=4840 RepID=UPI003743220C
MCIPSLLLYSHPKNTTSFLSNYSFMRFFFFYFHSTQITLHHLLHEDNADSAKCLVDYVPPKILQIDNQSAAKCHFNYRGHVVMTKTRYKHNFRML